MLSDIPQRVGGVLAVIKVLETLPYPNQLSPLKSQCPIQAEGQGHSPCLPFEGKNESMEWHGTEGQRGLRSLLLTCKLDGFGQIT